MAQIHAAKMRPYETHEQKIARFETALVQGGLIQTAKEAVTLLTVISHANVGDLTYVAQYLEMGIINRLQENLNTSPAVAPTTNSED